MSCALLGRALLFGAMYDTFRVAAVGEPDYLVTVTAGGAAKRRQRAGLFALRAAGGRRLALAERAAARAACRLARICCALHVAARERLLFLWNWGVLLTAINMLCLSAVLFSAAASADKALRQVRQRAGGLCRRGPPAPQQLRHPHRHRPVPAGTVSLNGLKIYGEESGKVISYAATMAHASQSGPEPPV